MLKSSESNYLAPSVHEVNISLERGFAQSGMFEDPDRQPEQEWQ